jgi:hypothetical protein
MVTRTTLTGGAYYLNGYYVARSRRASGATDAAARQERITGRDHCHCRIEAAVGSRSKGSEGGECGGDEREMRRRRRRRRSRKRV